jgi:hypothetical protein
MAACYEADGRMVDCVPVFSGSVPGGEEIQVDISLPKEWKGMDRVQFFLWERDTFRPLCPPWQPLN